MINSQIFNSIAYIKNILEDREVDETTMVVLSYNDSPVELLLKKKLVILYIYENMVSESFTYVQYRDLNKYHVTEEELVNLGLENLYTLAEKHLLVHSYDYGCYSISLEGNFEASLILLDTLWDISLLSYIETGYAVAIPCRSVLLFCDAEFRRSNRGNERVN